VPDESSSGRESRAGICSQSFASSAEKRRKESSRHSWNSWKYGVYPSCSYVMLRKSSSRQGSILGIETMMDCAQTGHLGDRSATLPLVSELHLTIVYGMTTEATSKLPFSTCYLATIEIGYLFCLH
jgi:hypothetical protein